MDSQPELIASAPAGGAPAFRAAAARWLHVAAKILRYATVFSIISVTMLIVGFGSILGSLFSHDD
ncbi:MAG TPA: hypothetical protein VHW25_00725 [Steroidobacteraceae bacterium]|jgi:hypothetical protein|nr:hypothetical protein [Steroidobacteraceae bacterium]